MCKLINTGINWKEENNDLNRNLLPSCLNLMTYDPNLNIKEA